MPDIFHRFLIKATPRQVFEAVATPAGLDAWWTMRSSGEPVEGTEYLLHFGSGYDWRAVVTGCVPDRKFELQMGTAHKDWQGTRVGFRLRGNDDLTRVHFYHISWPEANEHYRISCYCWAMYLRLLKRHVERGEVVPYKDRLEA